MIRKADINDVNEISCLSSLLWTDNSPKEMMPFYEKLVVDDESAVFICVEDGETVGFAQCQLRHDYVEGTDTSPVGYLEGIFVQPEHRGRGTARELLDRCEKWAAEKGCSEFASDCELTNTDSLNFHLKAGFSEANRIICFTKKLSK